MEIITWIIIGALVGWIAFLITKTNPERGAALGVLVGSLGAVMGGWLAGFLGDVAGLSLYGILAAVVGAIVFVGVAGLVRPA
jgi:uncharacterized membrane protein YeaQ/YmgE (transglycosylase-associated protein family)